MTRFLGDNLADDVPNVEGALFISPIDGAILTNSVLTRNAAGDLSANTGASLAAVISMPLTGLIRRIPALLIGLNNDGTNPVVGDLPVAKGIKITDITVHYQVTGAALTQNTIRMDRIKFVNNVANAITPVLANATNGLQTAIQANPYTTKVPIVDTFDTFDNDDLVLELAPTTQAAGAYRFYGCTIHFSFNLD